MAYIFYLGKIVLPIAPSKVQFEIKGNNKTINLINDSEINLIKGAKLTEIKFECILPQITNYPFAIYTRNEFKSAQYFLEEFKRLKKKRTPFNFRIGRTTSNFKALFDTNLKVTLEDYTITEDAKSGFDIEVSITLKEYKYIYTKMLVKKENGKLEVKENKKVEKEIDTTYTVKTNDTLYNIARLKLGDGARYKEIYKLNKVIIEDEAKKNGRKSSSNGSYIYKGTKLKLPN